MTETWRPIPGFEGAYEVSDLGRVRSLDRYVLKRNRWGDIGQVFSRGRALSQKRRKDGYYEVALYLDGRGESRLVHALVAAAFLGPRPSADHQVCHRHGDKSRNTTGDLRYDTSAGNNADKKAHGTHLEGERSPVAKLTAADVHEIRRRAGEPQKDLADEFRCTFSNISAIQLRKSWRHV